MSCFQIKDEYPKFVLGMGDHSRLALGALMIGLLAFNPFNGLFNSLSIENSSNDFSSTVEHRRILEQDVYGRLYFLLR